jgi:hypothetical protein
MWIESLRLYEIENRRVVFIEPIVLMHKMSLPVDIYDIQWRGQAFPLQLPQRQVLIPDIERHSPEVRHHRVPRQNLQIRRFNSL